MTVQAVHPWPTNSDLIADVAELGYLQQNWYVLDPTYGLGRFWAKFRPDDLVATDIDPKGGAERADFTKLPFVSEEFNAVVFDPPYKLNGTPALGDFDDGYGINTPTRWQDRMQLCLDGATECIRVLAPKGTLLWKCQDQVCSGKIRWQTRVFADHAEELGCELVDRFDMIGTGRPQPPGRKQVHAYGRPSTLLVFEKR